MAPHDDDRSAPHDDDLSSLYQQRKRRHPAPERLNEAVLATAKAEKTGHGRRGYGWKSAVSSAAAAVVIVVLGVNWLQDPVQTLSEDISLASDTADIETTESASSIMSEMSASDALPEPAKSAPAPAPQAEARRAEPADNGLSGADSPALMADQPLQFEALQAEPAASQPRFLKVIAGEEAVFEQCDGRLFEYDIPTAPSRGWFEVEWLQDGRIGEVTSRGIESPCQAP